LSLDSAHVTDDAAGIGPDHWARKFFRLIFCAFDDSQFSDLYQDGGRGPVSPALLAAITILQYIFRVSDRVAVDNTIMRRDWRIALGCTSNWTGFSPTVLVDFRKRLQGQPIREGLNTVLDQVRALGLLGGRRRVRVDATQILADVATLSRPEALQEAIRIVVCDLHKQYPELHQRLDFLRLFEAYGEEIWIGSPDAGVRLPGAVRQLSELGRDGYALLELCGERLVKGKDTLAQMLAENFIRSDDAEPVPLAAEERPPDHIVTPHEPEARVGKKGSKLWTGDKVHIVETADEDRPNFIVDVISTDPRVEDSTMTEQIAQRVRFAAPGADTLLGDGGYASAENTKVCAALGLDLISRPRPGNNRGLLPASEFNIDVARQVAICPAGHRSTLWQVRESSLRICFPTAACASCPRREECTTNTRGRSLRLSLNYEQLQLDRARASRPEYAKLYSRRAPIEATISHLVHRCGLRRSRYRGDPGRAFHALMAAAALNVRRLLRCLEPNEGPKTAAPAANVVFFGALLRLPTAFLGGPWRGLSAILAANRPLAAQSA
jgi:hypothetical protein